MNFDLISVHFDSNFCTFQTYFLCILKFSISLFVLLRFSDNNESQINRLKTPSSKLDKSDATSTLKKKKFSVSERKVLSPIRRNPNAKRAFSSDQGPRDRSRASTLFDEAVFPTDAGTSDDNEICIVTTPTRKSKRIAEKSRESAKKKQSLQDVFGNKSAENRWDEGKGSDLFGKPKLDYANLADDESQVDDVSVNENCIKQFFL